MKLKQINLKTKIYNHLMTNGNKQFCEKKVIKIIKFLQKNNKKNHVEILKLAVINSSPIIQLRQVKKKKGRIIKEFPYVIKQKNRISLGLKTLAKTLSTKLHEEFLSFAQNKNEQIKNKEARYKLALIKKKHVFFRWFL